MRVIAAIGTLVVLAMFAAAAQAAPRAVTTVAGDGAHGYRGDGGRAVSARLAAPKDVAPLPRGGFLIADNENQVVRKVSPAGKITTVAGSGTGGYTGDNGPATSAELDQPTAVARLRGGGFLIADTGNSAIRQVSAGGTITTVAGTGMAGYNGDNIPATTAKLFFPQDVAALPGGGFLIADSNNERIRMVSPAGMITTVAGDGTFGFAGDNGPATAAKLALPTGVTPTADGFLIADSDNSRIRAVSGGTIATVAGDGTVGYRGDGGRAVDARLRFPKGVAALPDGGFLIADTQNDAVREVSAAGRISTVAGTGPLRAGGANRPSLNMPNAVAPLSGGAFLIADTAANRIRWAGKAPKATITRHPGATLRARGKRAKVTFAFRSSQARSTFECKLDGSRYRPCRSPQSYGASTGKHAFRVKATNQFHATGRPALFRFEVRR